MAEGRVSATNAKRLADAVAQTSAEDVESDGELLAKAETMRPEDFSREARRWTAERQGDNPRFGWGADAAGTVAL